MTISVVVTGPVANWKSIPMDRITSAVLALRKDEPKTLKTSLGKATAAQNNGKARVKLHFARLLTRTANSCRRCSRNRRLAWGLYTWFMAAMIAVGATTNRLEATNAPEAAKAVSDPRRMGNTWARTVSRIFD